MEGQNKSVIIYSKPAAAIRDRCCAKLLQIDAMRHCVHTFRGNTVQYQLLPVVIRNTDHGIHLPAQSNFDGFQVFVLCVRQFVDLGTDAIVFHIVLNQNDSALQGIPDLQTGLGISWKFSL